MSDKKFLSAEEILGAQDIETVEVEVPEWGGVVRLRAMSGEEATRFVKTVGEDKSSSAIKIVALCAVKEDGTPLFTEEQVGQLQKKSLRALVRLQAEAMRINGLTEEAGAAIKNA